MSSCHCKRCYATMECRCGRKLDASRKLDATHALEWCEKCAPFTVDRDTSRHFVGCGCVGCTAERKSSPGV